MRTLGRLPQSFSAFYTHIDFYLTHTHARRVLQHFFSSAEAVVLPCIWLPPSSPLPSSLSPITGPKKKKKGGKNALLLVPMATALLFSFSAQSIRQRLSSCPAKGERYEDKYHFQIQVWHKGYFWSFPPTVSLPVLHLLFFFFCSSVTSNWQNKLYLRWPTTNMKWKQTVKFQWGNTMRYFYFESYFILPL